MTTVRREKLLYEWRDPVATRPAATVILVRDGSDGLELLMTRRSLSASFAPGAYVFPGGQVDDLDRQFARKHCASDAAKVEERAFACAAARESFEELGILLARDAAGRNPDTTAVEQMNRSTDADFYQQLESQAMSLALDDLVWFSHWITDRDLPRRFDTHFYIAPMPANQSPSADESEQFEPSWINPARGLAEYEAGQFNIIFPTIRTLRALTGFQSVQELLEHARSLTQVPQFCPRAGLLGDDVARFTQDETAFGELELVTPDGSVHHRLDWQHEPVQLLKHVWRITAPNPGRMTGPGTNTYVIGEPGNYVVIDPGPDHAEHIQRIASLVGDGLKTIICTHSHPDHYPGARPLRTLLGNEGIPILGRPSGPEFNPAWQFEPDRVVNDGEEIAAGQDKLRILHTPGHASNHVCLLLQADQLLFSGDHILNGSTTVIDHPDGDMKDYMDALHRLAGEPIGFILPAHGYVLGRAKYEIDKLIAHRLKRERKVAAALAQHGPGTVDELVVLAYDDVDPVLHPVAKRSLSAHLHKLHADGRANHADNRWSAL